MRIDTSIAVTPARISDGLASPGGGVERLKHLPAAKAAEEVEGLFASLIVKEMSKTLDNGSFFGGGPGSDVYGGMLEESLGREIARQGGFGLKDLVSRNMAGAASKPLAHAQPATPPIDVPGTEP